MSKHIRTVVWILLGALIATAIFLEIRSSLDPGQYFRYSHVEYPEWEHPTVGVAITAAITALEGLFAGLVLVGPWPKRFWIRGLIGASLLLVWGEISTYIFMHMPGFILVHHLWVLGLSYSVAAIFILVLFAQGAARLWGARTGEPTAPRSGSQL